ncbi:MAG TPA: 30S ribosomal protein S16 [Chloroflexi bacterium]|nr:30S ribosomal protein S16 [Chloroflexota bacterium]
MVKIRLRRVGAKKQASYRIVVADSRAPRDGRFVESIGFYNPRTDPETVRYREDRALYWLSVGAQPTDAVARLLEKQGTLARFARLKAGEPLEALLAEAEAAAQARPAPGLATRPVGAAVEEGEEAEGKVAEETVEEAIQAEDQGEEEPEA